MIFFTSLGIPSFDENDRKFARDKQLNYQEVFDPAEKKLINSKDVKYTLLISLIVLEIRNANKIRIEAERFDL